MYAIKDLPDSGPIFGAGNDLALSDGCSVKDGLGNTYKMPSDFPTMFRTILGGSEFFFCDDYEVFYLA